MASWYISLFEDSGTNSWICRNTVGVFYPGVRFAPPCSIWALHTTYVCMYVYMHAYIHTGLNIYTGPALFGVVGPVQATSFHILLGRWANIFLDRFYPISHSHRSSFQWLLALAIHPGATIKHKLHLNLILAMLYDFEIIKCYTSLARSIIKIHHGISCMAVC